MKMNISDLLDDYREENLVAEEATPLSMERIQRLTLHAVKPRKKHPVRSFLSKALIAAAMVSLFAVTAIADEREWKASDWFWPAVDQKIQEEMQRPEHQEQTQPYREWMQTVAQNQLAVIDKHGKAVNQSVSKNGATVTLLALYGDEYTLNLYLRVEAPEGIVLPDGEYQFKQPGSNAIPIAVPAGYKTKQLHFWNPQTMPDDDPTDNVKDFMLSLNLDARDWPPGDWETWDFSDSVPKKFILRGLYMDTGYEKVDKTYKNTYETLFIGPFEFDATNAHDVKRMEIDVSGCGYSGHIQDGKHPGTGEYAVDFTYTITPVRMAVSPFSVEVEAEFTGLYSNLDFEIVMKDGTSQKFGYDAVGGVLESDVEDGRSRQVVKFTHPIDPEQIDYVLIGDLRFGDTIHKVYP